MGRKLGSRVALGAVLGMERKKVRRAECKESGRPGRTYLFPTQSKSNPRPRPAHFYQAPLTSLPGVQGPLPRSLPRAQPRTPGRPSQLTQAEPFLTFLRLFPAPPWGRGWLLPGGPGAEFLKCLGREAGQTRGHHCYL